MKTEIPLMRYPLRKKDRNVVEFHKTMKKQTNKYSLLKKTKYFFVPSQDDRVVPELVVSEHLV